MGALLRLLKEKMGKNRKLSNTSSRKREVEIGHLVKHIARENDLPEVEQKEKMMEIMKQMKYEWGYAIPGIYLCKNN